MAIITNRTQKAVATDVGFKISKPGYDASRTAGNNLVFSSSWPSLPIAFETNLAGGFSASVAHGLGYAPFAMAWGYGTDPSGKVTTAMRLPLDSTTTTVSVGTLNDTQNLFFTGITRLNIKCFQLDLSQDVDYILAPGDTFKAPYDNSFGVKVAKANKDINSTDLRNFTVHSRCQSPLILAVKTEATRNPSSISTGGDPTIQYVSSLPNPVWVYGYTKSSTGKYVYTAYAAAAGLSRKVFTDGFTSYLSWSSSGGDTGATLVILRDPMFAATQTTVQY